MLSSHGTPSDASCIFNCDNSLIYKLNTNSRGILCLFRPGTKWVIRGRAKLYLLSGENVRIFGATIQPSDSVCHELFSPCLHLPMDLNIPNCSATSKGYSLDLIKDSLMKIAGISEDEFEVLVLALADRTVELNSSATAVFLQQLPSLVCDSIEHLKRFKELFTPKPSNDSDNGLTVCGDGFSLQTASPFDGFIESSEMGQIYQKVSSIGFIAPKILICGPGNSGKSTLLRFIINWLLTSVGRDAVAVLDCDVGQSEFTPSGMLSLTVVRNPIFGPPFTHPLKQLYKPLRKCFFGGTSPIADPSFYVKCLEYVFEAYHTTEAHQYPLVINTMGWTQGLGLSLLVNQVVMTKPNLIVQIFHDRLNNRQNLPPLTPGFIRNSRGWDYSDLSNEVFNHENVFLPSVARCGAGGFVSSHDNRDLTILGHLLADLENAETSLPGSGPLGRGAGYPLGHPTAHILDCLPYRVYLASMGENPDVTLAVRILHPPMGTDDKANPPELTLYTVPTMMSCLNATLVALAKVPDELVIPPSNPSQLTLISELPACECIGLAIVRAVDSSRGLVYLTTGVQPEQLMDVNAILRGHINLPQAISTEQPLPPEASLTADWVPEVPYLGPAQSRGAGRTAVVTRPYHPRVMHHHGNSDGNSAYQSPRQHRDRSNL